MKNTKQATPHRQNGLFRAARMMKNLTALMLACCSCQVLQAEVTISTDFTDVELQRQEMTNVWTVANRISPTKGAKIRPDMKVNLVRMIGGIKKVVDGENVPDLDFDPCTYDTNSGTYVYNWDPLIERFDAILNSGEEIHQVVLDQPPWAFQHGYTFIPEGTMDGVHFREDERVTTYGNSLPPADKAAYNAFIQAMITKLVETYGEELVMSWRFRVGSEIETPEHWKGTEQDFIEHFTNTAHAVRSVLPDAKVGIHTREPDFLYKNGTVLNYKGEVIQSFADGLIEHCHDNGVPFDFWGISDYVIITRDDDIDMAGKVDRLFGPLVDHPKWNADATLDIMEYKTITAMNGADGGGTVPCVSSHRDIVELGFAQHFYQHADLGLEHIHRWENRPGSSDPIGISMLNTMNGQVRYETQVTGAPAHAGNQLDAFFGKSTEEDAFDVLVYNYNGGSFDYLSEEEVALQFALALPAGTVLEYRCLSYAKENNELQVFLENEPPSGWIKDGFHRYGDPSRTLNEAGAAAFSTFVHTNEAAFGPWQTMQTVERPDGKTGSMVQVDTTLDSFAFQKYEFRIVPVEPVLDLLVGWENWAYTASGANHHNATTQNGASGTTANDTAWSLSWKGACPDGTFGALSNAVAMADVNRGSDSSGNLYGGRVENVPAGEQRSIDFVLTETAGTGADLAYFHFDMACRGTGGPDTWTLEVLPGSAVSMGVVASGNITSSWDDDLGDVDVSLLDLADNYLNAGETVRFRLTIGGGTATKHVDFDNVGVSKIVPGPPQVEAGPDLALVDTDGDGVEPFMLDGGGSVVLGDGSLAEYLWSRGSIPLATGMTANIELPIGTHLITLQITDSYGAIDSDQRVLTVVPSPAITTNVLAGWDRNWESINAAVVDGATAYLTEQAGDDWSPNFRASSNDGTFGTFPGADPTFSNEGASTHLLGFRASNMTDTTLDFTVTDTSGIARKLHGFSFDAVRRDGSSSDFASYTLSVLSGDLTQGVVVGGSGSIDNSWDENVLSDYDIDLTGLADHTLDANGTVTFRLTFTAPAAKHLDLDNLAITVVENIYGDADENGLPDWWENYYYGSTGQVAGADSDGDGLTNGDELIAGTDPRALNSVFAVHDFENASNGFTLRWEGRLDRIYHVMKGASLVSKDWNSISGPLPGTGGEMSFTDASPVSPSNTFYKVQVNQP